jgi:hypothetical protein
VTRLWCVVFAVTALVVLEHALQQAPGCVCHHKYLSLLFTLVFIICTVLPQIWWLFILVGALDWFVHFLICHWGPFEILIFTTIS